MWEYTGQQRPPFATSPGPEQESVWDYPRPPALLDYQGLVTVGTDTHLIASTRRALRVLETASPPTFYLPPDSIDWQRLVSAPGTSFCEWKGEAAYWALADAPGTVIGWSYDNPVDHFARISRHLSFYPSLIPCHVDGERVRPQPGRFYGGWITDRVVGPFKGEPGTGHW